MAVPLTTPVTGSAQTGFSAHTYTIVADVAPDSNARQYAVTVNNGTQAGVRIHTPSDPFTVTQFRPKTFQAVGVPNPATGVVKGNAMNRYRQLTRKGVLPAANQSAKVMMIDTISSVPAGADTYDAPNVRACWALHIGALSQQSAGWGDTSVSGIL